MGRSAMGFAVFLGVYNGVSCSVERLRGGAKDFFNPLCGGCAAGAMAGLGSRNSRTVLYSALGTGAITSLVTVLTGGNGLQGGRAS